MEGPILVVQNVVERCNMKRRDFLTYGTSFLGGAYLASSNVGVSYADEYSPKLTKNDKSVIFLWLGGGATHIETFNPIPYAPVERRSATGHIDTKIPTVKIGGLSSKRLQKGLIKSISSEVLHTKTLITKPRPIGLLAAKETKAALHRTIQATGL